MPKTTTLNLKEPKGEPVAPEVGEHEALNRLKAELVQSYAAPESTYEVLTADDLIKRNKP